MTCPDDPAAARRMLTPPNYLEPHVEVKESDVGKLKRKLAIAEKAIYLKDAELMCYRMQYPGWAFSESQLCLYQRGTHIDFDDDGGEGM